MKSLLGNSRKPDITFCSGGRIDITARVARLLRLREGDVIDIMSHDGELYLYVRHRQACGRHQACVYPSNPHGRHFRAASAKLCAAVLAASGADGRAALCVGRQLESSLHGTMLPLITKLLL